MISELSKRWRYIPYFEQDILPLRDYSYQMFFHTSLISFNNKMLNFMLIKGKIIKVKVILLIKSTILKINQGHMKNSFIICITMLNIADKVEFVANSSILLSLIKKLQK